MVVILTSDEILSRGLELAGYEWDRRQRVSKATQLDRFNACYGSLPIVYAQIWEDLQTSDTPEAFIDIEDLDDVDRFLMGIYWLKCYPTESVLAGIFPVCEKTARVWSQFYARKIQALKHEKILWPEDLAEDDDREIHFLSVDGVHTITNETRHPTRSKNKDIYSHKHNHAGLAYELGLSVFTSDLIWMNGPFPAAMNDLTIFRTKGLKEKMPPGKKGIADNAYRGEASLVTRNSHDRPEVRKFKRRVRARHETFNARIKNFKCLSEQFRHDIEKHQVVFEAVCVICQYQMENGSPLMEV